MQPEVRYHPSGDQLALAGALNDSLAELLPLSRLHVSREESAATWSSLRELGVFGIATPEALGGSGLGATEEALIAIELGRRVVAPAVLATLGAGHARASGEGRLEPGAVRVAAAYRHGDRIIVVHDADAEQVLLRGESDAAIFERPAALQDIDDQLWGARLRTAAHVGDPVAVFDAAGVLRLRLIDAAALAGIAEAGLEMAVAYAGVREQFGRPIGAFQAVKHHCANMAIAARCAHDQTSFAAVAIDDGRDDAALQVECALLMAATAAIENAGKNIQIHGGIGFSDEADPHLLLKRAQVLTAIAGGIEAATTRVGNAKSNW